MDDVKMVVVMRNDLNMRKGKMVAQGGHAVSAFLVQRINKGETWSRIEQEWLKTGTKKVCVRAESEEELLAIYEKARAANLTVHLVTDSGLTEFNGVPTKTCLAIGPDYASEIDKITGELKLL